MRKQQFLKHTTKTKRNPQHPNTSAEISKVSDWRHVRTYDDDDVDDDEEDEANEIFKHLINVLMRDRQMSSLNVCAERNMRMMILYARGL